MQNHKKEKRKCKKIYAFPRRFGIYFKFFSYTLFTKEIISYFVSINPSPKTSRTSVTMTKASGSRARVSSLRCTISFLDTTQKSMFFSSPEYMPFADSPVTPRLRSSISIRDSSSGFLVIINAALENFRPSMMPSDTLDTR